MSTALTVASPEAGIAPQTASMPDQLAYIQHVGNVIAKSGLFGCRTDAQGQVLVLAALAENKSVIQISREYHVMPDGLSMKYDTMLAKFLAMGGKHRVIQRDADGAVIELTIDGQAQRFSFSWQDAVGEPFVYDKHGKFKTNYATPRARMQMLWARVVSDGVRVMAPGVVAGIYTPEEVDEFGKDGQLPAADQKPVKTVAAAKAVTAHAPVTVAPPQPANDWTVTNAEFTVETKPQVAAAAESVPFDPAPAQPATVTSGPATSEAAGSVETKLLMEIELLLQGLGVTVAQLAKSIATKHPDWPALEHLDVDRLATITNNLRLQVEKKRQTVAQA